MSAKGKYLWGVAFSAACVALAVSPGPKLVWGLVALLTLAGGGIAHFREVRAQEREKAKRRIGDKQALGAAVSAIGARTDSTVRDSTGQILAAGEASKEEILEAVKGEQLGDLRKRAVELADEMERWSEDRLREQLARPMRDDYVPPGNAASRQPDFEMRREYQSRFCDRVAAIRRGFVAHGLEDAGFERNLWWPSDGTGLYAVINGLRSLAQRAAAE